MRAGRLVAALAVLIVVGAAPVVDDEHGAREPSGEAEIPFEVLLDEGNCGLEEPLRLVIRSQEDWTRIWQEIHRTVEPVPTQPPVDFSREMVIVVAMGMCRSGGFDIAVRSIIARGEALEVTVQEAHPPPGAMVSMVLTQPVEIVRLERSDGKVIFVEDEKSP